jgi:predicted nucleic acid-binding Zn ribbon protein
MTECKLCGEPIHFNNDIVSERTGKKIPLDETDEPHNCPGWKAQHRKYYNCKDCGAEIYFDEVHISKSGKHIPLDKETGEPHQCDE